MYIAPTIGAVPTLLASVRSRIQSLPAMSLPRPLPTAGMTVRRAVTVSRAAPLSPVLTNAARFAVTPTPVRPPAPDILKRPILTTAMRPAIPSILRGTVLERIGLRPPMKPVAAARPTSPFAIVAAVQAVSRATSRPTSSPIPGRMLGRLRRKAMEPRTLRPGSIVSRLMEKVSAQGKPLPRSMFGRLAARARPVVVTPPAAVGPGAVPEGMAPLVPALAPAAESPYFSIEDLMAPAGPERFPTGEGEFVDEAPEPMFGSLDFDVALQEDTQSELPSWLEGAEDVALLESEPEEVPDELLSLATLDQGESRLPIVPPWLLTVGAILVALYAIQSANRPPGPRGGGRASWE